MKHFFTVFVIFALIGSLGAADKADTKKKNAIAGVYVGLVEDEQASLIIKSDGSLAPPRISRSVTDHVRIGFSKTSNP